MIRFKINRIQNKHTFNIIVIVVMFILSLSMIHRYSYIETKITQQKNNPFETESYTLDLFNSNYYLYYKSYQAEKNRDISPADIFLSKDTLKSIIKNASIDYYSGSLDEESIKNAFNQITKTDLGSMIRNSDGNIKFSCINTETGYTFSNYDFMGISNSIKKYAEAKQGDDNYSRIVDEYKYADRLISKNFRNCILIEYDKDGKFKLLYTNGFNKQKIDTFMLEHESDRKMKVEYAFDGELSNDFFGYNTSPIKNRLYIYAIPKTINNNFYTSNDTISRYINQTERKKFSLIEKIARIILIGVFIVGMILPKNLIARLYSIKSISKIPFEILLAILIRTYYTLLSNDVPVKVVRETINGNLLKEVMANNIPIWISKQVVNLINIGYWLFIFLLVFVFAAWSRIILTDGIKNYLRKKSLLIRLLTLIYKFILASIMKFINVDFTKRYNRLCILGIVIISLGSFFLILTGFVASYTIWITIILIYYISFIIFIKVVLREIKDSEQDYKSLFCLTENIANGNLDVDIMRQNVGIYEELKRQLVSIQEAYKKTVEDEIKSQKLKSELISNVSHDLKTPLTSIISYSDLLKSEKDLSPKSREYIDTISRKSERLKILIDDMFEISKAQSGSITLDLNNIDVVELIKQCIWEVEDRFSERNLVLRTKFPDKKIIVYLDGEKTYRIFENLLINMVKYAMTASRVYIEVEESDKEVSIVFKNISESEIDYDRDEITERFRRGDKSRNTEGSGLGLSIAKSYAQVQGGDLNIDLDGDLFKAIVIFKKS
nr:HAMP domain-containing sensor histidine kinase [uncultured Peptostreptococcus sp.]